MNYLTKKTEKITLTGLFVALGVLLPFILHGVAAGTVLLPMHIPVLCCGMLCGPLYGLACGLLVPTINCFLTGMPVLYPMYPIVLCELCVYGLISGAFFYKTPLGSKKGGIYLTLFSTMVCGRVVYGGMWSFLFLLNPQLKAPTVFAAVITGIPGIIVQIILVPAIVLAVRRGFRSYKKVPVAIQQIKENTAACVVLKDGAILKSAEGKGIKPILDFYDENILQGSTVVDKIVGKAAAMIMTAGGVKTCYAITISKPAQQWFYRHGVSVEYENCVDVIINRMGNGSCPMEKTVQDIDDEEQAITALRNKLKELSNG